MTPKLLYLGHLDRREQSRMTHGKYKDLLEGPSVKSVITHSPYVTTECYFFLNFFSSVGF